MNWYVVILIAGLYLGGAIRGLCQVVVFVLADAADAIHWGDVYAWPYYEAVDIKRWINKRIKRGNRG